MNAVVTSLLLFTIAVVCFQFSKAASQDELNAQNVKLTELTSKGDQFVIKLSKKHYDNFIAGKSRDYAVVIMFTAVHPDRKCDMCVDFYNEFKLVASSWNYFNSGPNKVYFFLADYDASSAVFQAFNLQGVPAVYHIPASLNRKMKKDKMPLYSEEDLTGQGIATFLKKSMKVDVKIKYPFPWKKVVGGTFSVLFLAVMIYFTREKFTLKMASLRNLAGCAILLFVYYFLGGAMWNVIHKSPFSVPDKGGQRKYIGQGRMEQLGAETYILMAIYAMMTLGFVVMTEAPRYKGRKFVKIGVMFLGLNLFVGFFQIMISTATFKQSYLPHTSVLWWL